MYINRKDGTLVEAELLSDGMWAVTENSGEINCFTEEDFREQYKEAMICPVDKRDCGLLCKGEHCGIHSKLIDCGITCEDKKYLCIPYIPEEYDVDNEPVFPICGTCNAQEEQISQIIARATKEVEELISIGEKMTEQKEQKPVFVENMPTVNTPPLSTQSNSQSLLLSDEEIRNILQTGGTPMDFSRAIAEAELRHLEELGIMYVKVIQERSVADGAGFKRMRKTIIYIPLSEYRKENEK